MPLEFDLPLEALWEYQGRNPRPDNFDACTFMKLGRLGTEGFTMVIDGVEHRTKNQQANSNTDPENQHMQAINFATYRRDTLGHI